MDHSHFAPIQYGQTFGNGPLAGRNSLTNNNGQPEYAVYFRIRFPTILGEDIGVIGELPELGGWDVHRCLKLQWSEDHVWETSVPLITNRAFFKYKYVVYKPTTQIEDGMDRLAELRVLPEIKNSSSSSRHVHRQRYHPDTKEVELSDEWQTFKVQFSLFHPQDVTLKLSGSRPEIGDWDNNSGQHILKRAPTSKLWMQKQYGTPMRPYQATIAFQQHRQTTINESIHMTYSYSIGNVGREYGERTQVRQIRIVDPSNYTGQYAQDLNQIDTVDCFLINGRLEKCDGNYIPSFRVAKIA